MNQDTTATLHPQTLNAIGRGLELHLIYGLEHQDQVVSQRDRMVMQRDMAAAVEATFGAIFVNSDKALAVVERGMEHFGLW